MSKIIAQTGGGKLGILSNALFNAGRKDALSGKEKQSDHAVYLDGYHAGMKEANDAVQ